MTDSERPAASAEPQAGSAQGRRAPLVAAGRTDIVALGRALMNEPHFVLAAAAHYGHKNQYWPPQYLSGKFMAEMSALKDNQEMLELRTAAKPPNPSEALAIAVARGELLQKN